MALNGNFNPLYDSSVYTTTSIKYGRTTKAAVINSYINRMDAADKIYDAESQLLRGTMNFAPDKLKELDPSYQGHTHVFVLRIPPMMTEVANGHVLANFDNTESSNSSADSLTQIRGAARAKAHCRNLKALFEMGCTAYSGTPNLTLNTSQVPTGWNERSYTVPTTSAYDGTTFTLRCLETRGEPLRRGIEYYISGLTDPNTKTTMMNGATERINGKTIPMRPTLANMTWSFMIVQTDQTELWIQDISIWQNCIITSPVDRSGLDWEQGTVDILQPRDIEFTGQYMPDAHNPQIDARAKALLSTRLKYYRRYQDMDESWLNASGWHAPLSAGYSGSQRYGT